MPTGFLAWALHRFTRVPYVLTAHLGDVPGGVPEQTDTLFGLVNPIARHVWADAAACTAVSTFVQQLAAEAYGRPVTRILNGVDLSNAELPFFPPAKPRHIVFLGRMSVQKNPVFLVDALANWGFFDCQRSWFARGRADPAVRIFRYEDLASDDTAFLRDLLGYLGVEMSDQEFRGLCERHAFARYAKGRDKGMEDHSSHYRRGASGDWREKFTGKIREHFRATTGDLAAVLGYEP